MLINNKNSAKIGDKLKEYIKQDSKLSIISGLFSIYAYDALKSELEKVESVRLLLSRIGESPDNSEHLEIHLNGDDNETRLRNALNQSKVARECASWIANKAQVKVIQRPGAVTQTLYHTSGDSLNFAIQGSSNFTTTGLGYTESGSFDMNMGFTDAENTSALITWFDSIWNNQAAVQEAKGLLEQQLELLFKDQPPQFIYFLTLYNIFKDFIEQIDEEKIIRTKTGFKNTLVWNKLYKFQRDGVIGAIDKIERYNGCIIADSVGLGKTFEALAVIKYYELRNDRVLVLCPKKLRDNWTMFTVNDKRNLFADDRFNYDVLNHTDLTREDGKSGEINLETINWGNYDLIVIDESHNFRNNNPRKDGKTRYSKLMGDIIRAGVKTKVLMLSATPVNNRMNDLKNQVSFITEGKDDALMDNGIYSIEQTLRLAQSRFNQWVKQDPKTRNVQTLMDNMNFDYFKLLDIFTIARSRKHIEKYYGTADMGKFPERLKPQNIKADIDSQNEYPPLYEVNRTIRRLHLSAYSPLKYVRMEKREEYSRKYDMAVKDGKGGVFKQADREQSLIHLMRINLLKRMESSIHSFGQTVENLLNTVNGLINVIDQHKVSEIDELSIEDIDLDSPELESLLIGRKVKVLVQDMDLELWKQELQEDRYQLQYLLDDAKLIDANRDAKLQELKAVIKAKVNNPINANNKKIIIFTAFADTANYLYNHIAHWALTELDIHSALVTGTGTNKTTLKGPKGEHTSSELGSILTNFSPISKERNKIDPTATTEIDLMVATDCISEGQNLQDCDALVNYDIHWNPVRIIQRFGRIDRLGSKNTKIQLINFWPNMALDEYINLEAKVSGRMVLLDISATGEENVIEQDESNQMNDLEYRRKQLEQLQDAVVDLEDIAGGVSITDLTLNDFRMDLSAYMQAYLKQLTQAPMGLYSVAKLDETLRNDGLPTGMILCLKNIRNKVQVDPSYALAPYFMVYVADSGEIKYPFTNTKHILDVLKKQASDGHELDTHAISIFNKQTKQGADMQHYQQLLAAAIDSIAGKSQEKGVQSLFARGGTVLTASSSQGIEDFEVISYLILQ